MTIYYVRFYPLKKRDLSLSDALFVNCCKNGDLKIAKQLIYNRYIHIHVYVLALFIALIYKQVHILKWLCSSKHIDSDYASNFDSDYASNFDSDSD